MTSLLFVQRNVVKEVLKGQPPIAFGIIHTFLPALFPIESANLQSRGKTGLNSDKWPEVSYMSKLQRLLMPPPHPLHI